MINKILVLLAVIVFTTAPTFAATRWEGSPQNWNNSQNNWENSPNNWKNSPNNWENSPQNFNRSNGVYDNNGNAIGYTVQKESGGANFFSSRGGRVGYSNDQANSE